MGGAGGGAGAGAGAGAVVVALAILRMNASSLQASSLSKSTVGIISIFLRFIPCTE